MLYFSFHRGGYGQALHRLAPFPLPIPYKDFFLVQPLVAQMWFVDLGLLFDSGWLYNSNWEGHQGYANTCPSNARVEVNRPTNYASIQRRDSNF